MVRASTPPGTSWADGMRLGSPDRVVPAAGGSAAAAAACQPMSADVRQPFSGDGATPPGGSVGIVGGFRPGGTYGGSFPDR